MISSVGMGLLAPTVPGIIDKVLEGREHGPFGGKLREVDRPLVVAAAGVGLDRHLHDLVALAQPRRRL